MRVPFDRDLTLRFEILRNSQKPLSKGLEGTLFHTSDLRVSDPSQLYNKSHTTRSQGCTVDGCHLIKCKVIRVPF